MTTAEKTLKDQTNRWIGREDNPSSGPMNKISSLVDNLSPQSWLIILLTSGVGFIFFNLWLGILFEETGYPVALLTSQMRFNAANLKSDFSVLISEGTLNDYKMIQYLDVGIMVSTAVFFGALTLFSIKGFDKNSDWRKRGYMVALLFPLSGLLDAIENVFLLIMLEDPLGFPDWLAYVYSSLALAKLVVFIIGIISLIIVSIAGRRNK
ncbi:MAG: hypothetical protein ACE5OZ_01400 [Candidatus Heimdallarchaeota archaeon]